MARKGLPEQYARACARHESSQMAIAIRCTRTGRRCFEVACRERHWCLQMLECGLSARGQPLKHKFQPRCRAKTRAGAPCIMRVVPRKRRCRLHGGKSTGPRTDAGRARIAAAQRRRWKILSGEESEIVSEPIHATRGIPRVGKFVDAPTPARGVDSLTRSHRRIDASWIN